MQVFVVIEQNSNSVQCMPPGGGMKQTFDFPSPSPFSTENKKKPPTKAVLSMQNSVLPRQNTIVASKSSILSTFLLDSTTWVLKNRAKNKERYTDIVDALKSLEHICKLEAMLLNDGVTPYCIYMNAVTHRLLESPDTIIGYPVVVDNKFGDDIVCLA